MQKSNINLNEKNRPVFSDNFETSVAGLYLARDIIYNNGGSISMAINHAFTIITDIMSKK